MNFNFEGKDYGEIFLLPKDRQDAITDHFNMVISDIVADPTGYYCQCDNCAKKANEDKGLHSGLILKKAISGMNGENEIFFAVCQLEHICKVIEKKLNAKRISEAIKEVIENLFK